ncbi:PAS domain-containing sensor histidine kinase [Luteimonas kalidii]|uniref:histidine kinase n=1 Tax=Luteimonas kalidii TaxID=3042025 RepID=A0ABT6JNR3_9GAMM|nr:PAS domain-containing sensor histidine kinase [Luteimonas kalidii]MDH5832327.1 PAS domain-containing sensor histidine kinase [Luteimonas kalidii]
MEALSPTVYRQAFDGVDAALAVLSPHGEWLSANPALCRLFARTAETLVGTRAHEQLFEPSLRDRIAALCAAPPADPLQRQVLASEEGAGPDPASEGSAAWRVTMTRLAADGAWLMQCEDIVPERRRARQDAEAARLQEHIAHGLSHDLRAPLRGIAGFAARLDESAAVAEAGKPDLARIRSAAVRAERLVQALLELLRASRQPLRTREVDVSLLCEWVAAELQDEDAMRAATVEVPAGLAAHGDEHALKLLLRQVLHNAWKFSAARERVEITIEGVRDGDRLRLSVRDRGCGFDMRYADKLFLPFQRLHGAEQGGGDGLGLAIAQQVAARHGGRIWAESHPDEGSTFFIELPAGAGEGGEHRP